MNNHSDRARPRLLTALIIGSLALAACGSDDDDAATAPAESATTTAQQPATTAPPAADDAGIEVTAADYRYDDLPSEVDAGTSLTLRNASTTEIHELVAIRLPDDESRTVQDLLALPMEELEALFAGLPALVAIAPPAEDGFVAVGDGRLTEPGRYAIACFIPIGADPEAFLAALEANPGEPPQVEGGPPHFTAGMFGELTVA